jgi:hypothetical protein
MAQQAEVDKATLHVMLLEAQRQQRMERDPLAPIKGILVGTMAGLAVWGMLFFGWLLVA